MSTKSSGVGCALPRDLFGQFLEMLDVETLLCMQQSGLILAQELLNTERGESTYWETALRLEWDRIELPTEGRMAEKIRSFWDSLIDPALASIIFLDHPIKQPIRWSNPDRIHYICSLINLKMDPDSVPWIGPVFKRRMVTEMFRYKDQGYVALTYEDWKVLYAEYLSSKAEESSDVTVPPPPKLEFGARDSDLSNASDLPTEFTSPLLYRFLFGDLKTRAIPYGYFVPEYKDGIIDMSMYSVRIIIPSSVIRSVYRGMINFEMKWELVKDYPFKPPKVKHCAPTVRHLSRCECGNPACWCLPFMKDEWTPAFYLFKLVHFLLRLFVDRSMPEEQFMIDLNANNDGELYRAYIRGTDNKSEYAKLIRDSLRKSGCIN